MSKLVCMKPLLKKLAQDAVLNAAAGPITGGLGGAKMIVYTQPVSLDSDTVLSDLTQPTVATWAGYAAVPLTWGAVVSAADGSYVLQAALVPWSFGPADAATNLAGYGIVDGTGATLLAAEQFDSPLPLVHDDDAITIGAQFKFDASGDFGAGVILAH